MAAHHASDVIAVLARVGVDPAQQRPFDFYLYFPTERAAAAAGRELSDSGFDSRVSPGARGDWLCLAAARLAPSDAALEAVLLLMETMAEDFGGAFDGWETRLAAH